MRSEPPTRELPPELQALERRFVLATTDVALPGGVVTLEHPRNADDLISEVEFARDERLPYWADIWPSATALATVVDRSAELLSRLTTTDRANPNGGPEQALPHRVRALELGCGVGLVTVAALRAGFDVTATDYYPDALLFTRRNAMRTLGMDPATRMVDWRDLPGDLGRFDLLLASDVLYERPYATLVCDAIVSSLAAGGVALVADPGRVALLTFITACEERGCTVSVRERVPWQDGTARQTITIHEIHAPQGA